MPAVKSEAKLEGHIKAVNNTALEDAPDGNNASRRVRVAPQRSSARKRRRDSDDSGNEAGPVVKQEREDDNHNPNPRPHVNHTAGGVAGDGGRPTILSVVQQAQARNAARDEVFVAVSRAIDAELSKYQSGGYSEVHQHAAREISATLMPVVVKSYRDTIYEGMRNVGR